MKAIIGKKVGMSQIFDENGHVIPVTVIEAGPCVVTQKKTTEKDGYEAVQLGYEDVAEKKLSKPEVGHLNKAGVSPKKYLREFALDNGSELELGAVIKADMFQVGDFVDVTGTSKGHGYEGVVKRCGYAIQRKSHGGGRKPWRQKGTGRARQGSTRSPQWTHGGIAFAPKPRTYSYVLNKKVKRLALKSVLSSKAQDGEIVVVDKIAMDEIKTKSFKNFLTAVNAEGKSVVVTPEVNDTVVKSARNIPGVVTSPAKLINVYDLLNAKTLVIDKDALAVIEEVFA